MKLKKIQLASRWRFEIVTAACCVLVATARLITVPIECRASEPVDQSVLAPYESGPTLVGKVLLPNGEPANKADVHLLASKQYVIPKVTLQTQCDANGNFRYDSVPPGSYAIFAETENSTSMIRFWAARRVQITSDETDVAPLEIPTYNGCGYDVTVMAPDSSPIENAVIKFAWTDIDRSYSTNRYGLSQIRNLPVNKWHFVVSADGYATEFLKTSKQKLGSIVPLRFELKPGATLSGRLEDELGEPVVGVKLYFTAADISTSPDYATPISDENGRFVVHGLPRDKRVRIFASQEGYLGLFETITVVESNVEDRIFSMPRRPYGGDVEVTVTSETGEPIADAIIVNRGNSSRDVRSGKTDSNGQALLQDVFASYTGVVVSARAPGFIGGSVVVKNLSENQQGQVQIQLRKGKTFSGRLLTPAGEPLPGVKVWTGAFGIGIGGADPKTTVTDTDGVFSFDGLSSTVSLSAAVPSEYAPLKNRSVRTGSDEVVDINLVPAANLMVQAIDKETGKPLNEFNVRLDFCEDLQPGDVRAGSFEAALRNPGTNIQGETKFFQLERQIPGTAYRVTVSSEGYEAAIVPRLVTVENSKAKPYGILLEKKRSSDYITVAGRLTDADGQPVVGAAVRLLVGSAIPMVQPPKSPIPKINPVPDAGPLGKWKYYNWDLLKRDDLESRDQCRQLLKTVSGSDGEFEFEGVDGTMPWYELYYHGDKHLSQRFSNLRSYNNEQLKSLVLKAEQPASLSVRIEKDDYPEATHVNLMADNYLEGVNAIKTAFSYTTQPLAEVNMFNLLPSGNYVVTIQTVTPIGENMQRSTGIASRKLTIEAGQSLEIDFRP